MSLFNKIFGSKNRGDEFEEGDVFYTFSNGHYHLYKLLKLDRKNETYHVLCYQVLNALPKPSDLDTLGVAVFHAPIDIDGFGDPVLFSNKPVMAADLIGYHEFLRQTGALELVLTTANGYYQLANKLAETKQYELAIDEYSKAIDLVPQFFEAIDNRAFSKMDLARWTEAIEDFRMSLAVNPNSLLAEFSIGECYFKLKDYERAKKQFQNAVSIDSTHQLSQDFLIKTMELMRKE